MKSNNIRGTNTKDSISPVDNIRNSKIKTQKGIKIVLYIGIPILLISLLIGIFYWYYSPSTKFSNQQNHVLILNDIPFSNEQAFLENNRIYVSFEAIKENLDESIFWEEENNRVIITTSDKIIDLDTKLLETAINYQTIDIDTPFLMKNETPFIDLSFISPLYNLNVETLDSGVVAINSYETSLMKVKAIDSINAIPHIFLYTDFVLDDGFFIRKEPSFRSLRVELISPEDILTVYDEDSGWYKVRSSNGYIGYLDKNVVKLEEIIEKQKDEKFFSPPWRPIGEKINLTWDYMSFTRQDMSGYETVPGLNVISPTWFHLKNSSGDIINHGSNAYVEWAHSENIHVWALFSNNFDPDITSDVIRNFETRKKVITQIMMLSDLLNIDGINIDFENMYYEDKDFLTQFVREFTPMMHELGLTVSIDVTFISSSEMWSMFYDREQLGKVVDYMAVMAYDEHWASSPLAGSVASLPWVESNLERILEQVPAHKILLGVPFYTRLWPVESFESNTRRDLSITYSMNGVNELIEEKNLPVVYDEVAMQNYIEYEDEGQVYKLWIEDEISMKSRIDIIHKYELAGIASWRKGFEVPEIWSIIEENLN